LDKNRDAIGALRKTPSFEGLDALSLKAIAKAAIQRSFDKGSVVFLEGEPATGLYIVRDGWLKSFKISLKGREQVVRFVGPGDAFNEIGALAGGVNQANVEALEPANGWIIPSKALHSVADEGLIRIDRQELQILDRKGLEAKAHLSG